MTANSGNPIVDLGDERPAAFNVLDRKINRIRMLQQMVPISVVRQRRPSPQVQ